MDTLVNVAFNLWFGGVAAYSIAKLTWCLRWVFVTYLQYFAANT